MGEYTYTFTVKEFSGRVRRLTGEYWKKLGYAVKEKDKLRENYLVVERGERKKNIYSFSFDKVYRRVSFLFVPNLHARVTTVQVRASFPWVKLSAVNLREFQSILDSYEKHINYTVETVPVDYVHEIEST